MVGLDFARPAMIRIGNTGAAQRPADALAAVKVDGRRAPAPIRHVAREHPAFGPRQHEAMTMTESGFPGSFLGPPRAATAHSCRNEGVARRILIRWMACSPSFRQRRRVFHRDSLKKSLR